MLDFDDDFKREIMDGFRDLYNDVEPHLIALPRDLSEHRLNAIFRSIHTIKGNAAVLQLKPLVDFTHSIEEVVESLRQKRIPVSAPLCETIQLCMDRLRDLHQREVMGFEFPNLQEDLIKDALLAIAKSDTQGLDERILALQHEMSDGYPAAISTDDPEQNKPAAKPKIAIPSLPEGSSRQILDLAFFQELSFRIEINNANWVDRTIQIFDWAHKINRSAGNPVNYEQLAAATYMHDVGMSFVRIDTLQKPDNLDDIDKQEIRRHVAWGYDFLIRMPGWEEAALIVLNHHERVDGKGYPNGLTSEYIHPGAKILAIVDAFFSMINTRADRQQRKSVLRAVSEINAASGSQFDSFWVKAFNDMIKDEAKHGAL